MVVVVLVAMVVVVLVAMVVVVLVAMSVITLVTIAVITAAAAVGVPMAFGVAVVMLGSTIVPVYILGLRLLLFGVFLCDRCLKRRFDIVLRHLGRRLVDLEHQLRPWLCSYQGQYDMHALRNMRARSFASGC